MDKRKEHINSLIDGARRIVEKEQFGLITMNRMLSPKSLLPYAQWSEDKPFTRVCLYEDEEFELILICWQPYAKTAIHNHNEQNCWVFFFNSAFEEVIYCEEGKHELEINRVKKGGVSFMKEMNKCHSLQNLSNFPSMSLHLYNEPIKSCEIVSASDSDASLDRADLNYDVKLSYA